MKKIKLAITGCMGRMGQQIIKSAKSNNNFAVTVLTENRLIKKKISGINLGLNTEKTLNKAKKLTNIPIVAIGGITNKNYKKLLLNNANFLAISGYIWNNKKYKPIEAIEILK